MEDFSKTTIIIPTLNEEQNIGQLVGRLKGLYPTIKIMVTDDGSTDGTVKNARLYGAVVIDRKLEKVKGITAAVLDALKCVTTDNIVVMDADFQHPPEKVKEILNALKRQDIVIAARKKVVGPWGPVRRLESRIARLLALTRLRRNVKDPLSGFFGIKTALFKNIKKKNFEMRCFKILFNILKNTDKKVRIGYVFYDFEIRKRGESKIGKKHIWHFLKNVFK